MIVARPNPVEFLSTVALGPNWRLQFTDPEGTPMNMGSFEAIDFGAISYKEIFQNVKTILATPIESAALERSLGVDQGIVDRPINEASRVTIAILTALTMWEPRCATVNIEFEADTINGHLTVLLQLQIRNVIYGTNTPYPSKDILPPPRQELPMTTPVPGPPGPPGPTGPRGSLWFVGTTDPGPTIGTAVPLQVNDMYLNTTSGDVFQFTADPTGLRSWSVVWKGVGTDGLDQRR